MAKRFPGLSPLWQGLWVGIKSIGNFPFPLDRIAKIQIKSCVNTHLEKLWLKPY
ncbi:unknown protein [Microcystis aeruginosa NIES-843]|uniref:Uncharacterized protein n=1 Tax=Microcystis aeruginosa (strain NIES-843 / IAM M-2473) TaxID=449447 RepID=B0JSK0_MICAN|nr:unknown protein [Microcystis aeruginosa NIES-843]